MADGARKHSVKVEILGESYTVRTEAAPEHTRAVAQHLDHAIRQILASGTLLESNRAAILAAMQITSELFEAREAATSLTAKLTELSAEVRHMLPPAKRAPDSDAPAELSV